MTDKFTFCAVSAAIGYAVRCYECGDVDEDKALEVGFDEFKIDIEDLPAAANLVYESAIEDYRQDED